MYTMVPLVAFVCIAGAQSTFAQSSFVTHIARQMTNSEGGRIEQTAASLDLPASSTPEPSPGPLTDVDDVDKNITSWAWLWGWHGCSNGQKSAILNGLKDAHTVLGTDGVYNIDKHWNDFAVVEFFGSPYLLNKKDQQKGIRGMSLVRYLTITLAQTLMPLTEKFGRAYGYQQSWYSWYDTRVYCARDLEDVCTKKEPGYIWVENSDGDKKKYLSLAFCDRYFKLGTLEGIYDATSKSQRANDLSEYENRARAWITAIMRINWIRKSDPVGSQLVNYGGRRQFAESCSEAKFTAKSNGGYGEGEALSPNPLLNASNYAWYALAQWVQQKSGNYAQQPYVPDDVKAVQWKREL